VIRAAPGRHHEPLAGLFERLGGVCAAVILMPVNPAQPAAQAAIVVDAQRAYGWPDDVVVSAGPRGALGQIWQVRTGPQRYALKEIFADPPSEAVIAAELTFSQRAAEAGVRLPQSHSDRDGRYLHTTPGGRWLRLYDWIDLRPVDLTAPATPDELGVLLARLHRCAPAATTRPSPWYESVPDMRDWDQVAAADARLRHNLATLPQLCAAVAPADLDRLILCHRDLHPENVLADPHGALVIIDWDNLGPAAPGRELARALFDWFSDPTADLDAMRTMYAAYVAEGGPGRIDEPADFTMLLACRLNFLLGQARVALDPQAEERHRAWAEREVDEALRILPTPRDLAAVLAFTRVAG
jgi:Ser/Thr protein kinase RdoA (MazF antagonist)